MMLLHTDIVLCATDVLSCLYGPSEEHDLPLWTWHLSDVWRPHAWMPDLSQANWKTYTSLLNLRDSAKRLSLL